jgi:hypothetical protein
MPFCMPTSVPSYLPGPSWNSFEQFRKGGPANVDSIPQFGVATLKTKAGTFRIMRSEDFNVLYGLAIEVSRVRNGMTVFAQAARICILHPDHEHIKMLVESASLLTQMPALPQRKGHDEFRLGENENSDLEDSNISPEDVPRSKW